MRELFDRVRNLYGYATAYNADPNLKHLQKLRDHNLAEFDRMIAQVEAAAEQRGAVRGWDEAIDYAWDDSSIYQADAARAKSKNPYRADQEGTQDG